MQAPIFDEEMVMLYGDSNGYDDGGGGGGSSGG